MTTPQTDPARARRTPRRDALRNDATVMEAARAVFAEQGPQASMETIAERAGLGVGTIYRRFAGKEALLDAIAQTFIQEMDQAAEAALADPDPGRGLERFLDFVGAFNAEKRHYSAVLADRVVNDKASERTTAQIQQLTRNAIDAGSLAADVTDADIKALIVAIRGVVAASPDDDNTHWRRFMRIHLAGLREHVTPT